MNRSETRDIVLHELATNDGLLPMKPAWVSRDFLPPGKRLGLTEAEYDLGARGAVCERWIVSETKAENPIDTPNEGLSYVKTESGAPLLLTEALAACPGALLGEAYARTHKSLDRLLKIFDYGTRVFYHIHQRKADAAEVGMNSKEEAYYFLDADLGAHPETFFGVHPSIVEDGLQEALFTPYLKAWKGDSILRHSIAYANVPGEGFHLAPGILHAPGTALTLELQESSDIMAVLQADLDGIRIDKRLLTRHIAPGRVAAKGEASVLDLIDWGASGDPYFYENHHLSPQPIAEAVADGVAEEWVWYNSTRFNGTRVTIEPGAAYLSKGRGVHGIFVWKGRGTIDAFPVEGQTVSLTDSSDEFLVTHDKAVKGVAIRNTGAVPLVLFKFYGPDINDDIVPMIKHRSARA
jgi:hypothetical protein